MIITNNGLKKPTLDENYSLSVTNDNVDVIDNFIDDTKVNQQIKTYQSVSTRSWKRIAYTTNTTGIAHGTFVIEKAQNEREPELMVFNVLKGVGSDVSVNQINAVNVDDITKMRVVYDDDTCYIDFYYDTSSRTADITVYLYDTTSFALYDTLSDGGVPTVYTETSRYFKSNTITADGDELSQVSQKGTLSSSQNLFYLNGNYYKVYRALDISGMTNLPPNATSPAIVEMIPSEDSLKKLVWTETSGTKRVMECTFNPVTHTVVDDWIIIATTYKVDISSRLLNSWVNSSSSVPLTLTISGKMATINGYIKDGTITRNTVLFTLPNGILPAITGFLPVHQHLSPLVPRAVRIDTGSSNVNIDNNFDWVTGEYILSFTLPIQ